MFDPEGSHNELARHSRVDEATAVTSTLQHLPPELILRIASLLGVRDLLALRRTYRSIYRITQDKLLWRGLLRDLRPPLPRTLRSRRLESLSYPELEEATLHYDAVEHQWLKRRESILMLFTMEGSNIRYPNILLLEFLDDRWLIFIPVNGSPIIWDTQENPPKLCEFTSHHYETWDAAVGVDPCQGDIVIVLWGEYKLQVLRAHLTEPMGDSLRLTDHGTIDDSDLRKFSLEPSRSAVISEFIDFGIEIRDWTRNRSVMISTARMDYDDDREPILGLRLVGDYILCFTSKWIELFYAPPFPDADDEKLILELDPTSHPFHPKCLGFAFDGASLSEPQPNPGCLNTSRIIYILAYQAIVGFYYFRVTIHNSDYAPSGPRARMDVDLVGVYELEKPRAGVGGVDEIRVASGSWLGPEGKRGIWVESLSRKPKRFVVAVSFDQTCSGGVPVDSGDNLEELRKIAPRIESTSDVFVIDYWDPSGGWALTSDYRSVEKLKYFPDDIVQYAFSESTGKIALGTQDNRIISL